MINTQGNGQSVGRTQFDPMQLEMLARQMQFRRPSPATLVLDRVGKLVVVGAVGALVYVGLEAIVPRVLTLILAFERTRRENVACTFAPRLLTFLELP